MFVTGHLSLAYLLHRASGWRLRLIAAAALFPDLVDKGLQGIGLFATGRHMAHNLFALALTAALVAAWQGRRAGLAWLAGYATHLLADLPFSWAMPWFFPLEFGTWHHSVETGFMNLSTGQLVLDLIITLLTLGLIGWERWGPSQASEKDG